MSVAVGWLLFTQVFLIGQAPDNEMFPAVEAGDLLIGYRLEQNLEKEDVVVYEAGGKTHVGRILGCETDVITMDDTGTLLVNGTAQTGEIALPTYAKEGITYPYTVPEGSVFILGDYRTHAKDSREFGPHLHGECKSKSDHHTSKKGTVKKVIVLPFLREHNNKCISCFL